MNGYRPESTWVPALGCLSIVAVLCLTCLLPVVLVDVMRTALERLHLSPPVALLAVGGIFVGSLINIPFYRIEREELQPIQWMGIFGLGGLIPRHERLRRDTVIAVNVGGCMIPVALAIWQVMQLFGAEGWPQIALILVIVINVGVCYRVARPVSGLGIQLPAFVPPLAAVIVTWLLLPMEQYTDIRAPVAFVGGVTGPLVGADLLHLRDISRISVGMLSIGGAGTFDGIVLSGFLAALLA